jgi:SAM-dependent methyltransferase
MIKKIKKEDKLLSFILSISKKELAMNGWIGDDPKLILKIYQSFTSFTKNGDYLELGCGTGILAKFINLSSNGKIIPHGVDININSIEIAKKNNPDYADNFIQQDYFNFLESNINNLSKFSNICLFVNSTKKDWLKLKKILVPIVKECNSTNFIVICYEYNFLNMQEKEVGEFISEMNKISKVSVATNLVIVIGKDKKIHTTAKELRENLLMDHQGDRE